MKPKKPKKRVTKKKPVMKKKPVKRKPVKNGLTIMQEKFCQEYIDTGNATESYRRVYSTSRMKDTTVNRNAKTLLDHSKISARIIELKEKLQRTYDIPRERLLYEMEAIVNAKITDYVEFDGKKVTFKSFDKLTDQQVRAIESIKQNEKGEIELKLQGKSWSTDRIAKILGLEAPKKIDHTSKGEKIDTGKVIILPTNGRDDHGSETV